MKRIVLTLFAIVFCISFSVARETPMTTFYVQMSIVQQLQKEGASGIKIFSGIDEKGALQTIMIGINDKGNRVSSMAYLQKQIDDCPPTCDFNATAITNSGTFIEISAANKMVNDYMKIYGDSDNAVTVCAHSIGVVMKKDYDYMRILFDSEIKISKLKSNGNVPLFGTFSNSCNTKAHCPLGE